MEFREHCLGAVGVDLVGAVMAVHRTREVARRGEERDDEDLHQGHVSGEW